MAAVRGDDTRLQRRWPHLPAPLRSYPRGPYAARRVYSHDSWI